MKRKNILMGASGFTVWAVAFGAIAYFTENRRWLEWQALMAIVGIFVIIGCLVDGYKGNCK